jgi:hypothetical protein
MNIGTNLGLMVGYQPKAPPFDFAQGRLSRNEREKWGTLAICGPILFVMPDGLLFNNAASSALQDIRDCIPCLHGACCLRLRTHFSQRTARNGAPKSNFDAIPNPQPALCRIFRYSTANPPNSPPVRALQAKSPTSRKGREKWGTQI